MPILHLSYNLQSRFICNQKIFNIALEILSYTAKAKNSEIKFS